MLCVLRMLCVRAVRAVLRAVRPVRAVRACRDCVRHRTGTPPEAATIAAIRPLTDGKGQQVHKP